MSLLDPSQKLGSQVIIRGETDGTMGMEHVKQLLNWNPDATLILSGGVYGRERSIGDIGAIDLFKHIEYDLSLYGYTPEEIKSRVIIDSFSQHTVDQGRILSGILNAIEAEDVIVVIPLYHMPRFLNVFASGFNKLGFKPNIIPEAYGKWPTHHPRKGPLDGPDKTYRYEQLFALPPTPSRLDGKFECGEVNKIVQGTKSGASMSFKQFRKWYALVSGAVDDTCRSAGHVSFPRGKRIEDKQHALRQMT